MASEKPDDLDFITAKNGRADRNVGAILKVRRKLHISRALFQ